MAKATSPTVTVGIYRIDQEAEHNSPRAWKSHKLRAQIFDSAVAQKSMRVVKVNNLYDEENTHEFAEAVIEFLREPTVQVALTAAGLYVFKHLTKPLDDYVENGVKRLYKSLASAFQKKQINEFFIQLPSGEQITVGPGADAVITIANGNPVNVKLTASERRANPKKRRR